MAKKRTRTEGMSKEDENNLRENPVNNCLCQACDDAKPMAFADFKKHLAEVHKLNPEQMKGNKQMVMHVDGDKWFSSTYQWTLECGLKFTQYIEMARRADDMMRYE